MYTCDMLCFIFFLFLNINPLLKQPHDIVQIEVDGTTKSQKAMI